MRLRRAFNPSDGLSTMAAVVPRPDLHAATPDAPVRLGGYDIVGTLGRGGMGTVYDAIEIEHGTRVALKTLKLRDPDRILQFKREFRQAADLQHPNLVRLYELVCEENIWFFAMERLEGRDFISDLGDRSSTDAPSEGAPAAATGSTWAETVTLLTTGDAAVPSSHRFFEEPRQLDSERLQRLRASLLQLVRALRSVHDAGLLHLDIKPSNIMVEPDGRVVLLDFGIARAPTDASAYEDLRGETRPEGPRRVTGTPVWMAPEQHEGKTVSEASDWYALGLVLYTALTGMRAFAVESPSALSYAKQNTQPIAPSQLVDVPADLSSLVTDLLEADPAMRPTGAQIEARLTGEGDAQSSQPLAPSFMVGRAAERQRLWDALAAAEDGRCSVVQLAGPSGIGKSALLRELHARVVRGNSIALRGRCYERENVPYKAFDGMLDELARKLAGRSNEDLDRYLPVWTDELTRVFPVLAGVRGIAGILAAREPLSDSLPAAEIQRRAVIALRELLAAIAEHRGCVIAIDDLQWADEDSCAALTELLADPLPPGLMVVLAYRDAEIEANAAAVAALARIDSRAEADEAALHYAEIEIGPLPVTDAIRLAAQSIGQSEFDADLLGRIAAVAEGSPFFVEELAHLAHRQLEAGESPTIEMNDLIQRRVEMLAPEERALVETLAVAGSPIPVGVAISVAAINEGVMRALWSLRRADFIRQGRGADRDAIQLRHDRLRESVLDALGDSHRVRLHRELGKALAQAGDEHLFDTVRHLNATASELSCDWRLRAAKLNLDAGRRARNGAAFGLAFECYEAVSQHLGAEAWTEHYGATLRAHEGAAEAAYLSARWDEVARLVDAVKKHAHTAVERLSVWETEIDTAIARNAYGDAVDAGVAAIAELGSQLPADPSQEEVGAEFQAAMGRLSEIGVEGVAARATADDPTHRASMRIHSRITSAAYFGRPNLLPVIACRMVVASLDKGLVPATPYALSILGIVLNTVSMHEAAHAWGQAALAMRDRFEDRSLDARTGHVVHDLVCNWVVHLDSTLPDVWGVYERGKELGDVEYASYAAHAYIHQAIYVCRPLAPLLETAESISEFMVGHDQVNALHVHEPFEQLLRCLLGLKDDPARLDGHGFSEAESLAAAEAAGSRSAMCLNRVVMGLARYHLGTPQQASEIFEAARPYLDGMPSVWHTPIFHQFAALSILQLEPAQREPLLEHVDTALAALRGHAASGAMNFAHRIDLVEGARALSEGRLEEAVASLERSCAQAREFGWLSDLGSAAQLLARVHLARGDDAASERARTVAVEAFTAWGATAKAAQLS